MKRNFINLWFGYSISAVGSSISFFAILIYLYSITGKALDIGIYTMVSIAASVISGPVVGVFVDRHDRRKIMILGNLINGLLILSIGFINAPMYIYIITFIMTIADKGIVSARMAMLPSIVDDVSLIRCNARISMTSFVTRILGPSLAGIMTAVMPFWVIFLIDALSYWIANAFIMRIDCKCITRQTMFENRFKEMVDGLKILLTNDPLPYFVTVGFLYRIFTSMLPPLLLVFVTTSLHGGSKEFGIISSMVGVGGIIGSVLAPWFGRFFSANHLMTVGVFISALLLLLFASSQSFWISTSAYLLFNINLFNFVINLHSHVQKIVADENRGKVFSSVGSLFGPAHLISITCGVLLADRFGAANVMVWSFGTLLAITFVVNVMYFLFSKFRVVCSNASI